MLYHALSHMGFPVEFHVDVRKPFITLHGQASRTFNGWKRASEWSSLNDGRYYQRMFSTMPSSSKINLKPHDEFLHLLRNLGSFLHV